MIIVPSTALQYLAAYFVFSAAAVRLLIPDHEKLDRKEKQYESTFKFVHNRMRNHAESIASFGGDDTEHAIARTQFKLLNDQFCHNRVQDAKFGIIDRCINKDGGDCEATSGPREWTKRLACVF